MTLWLVTYSVSDGEHEYCQTTTVEARTARFAENKWARENEFEKVSHFGGEVYQSKDHFDYRYYEIETVERACPCCLGAGIHNKGARL